MNEGYSFDTVIERRGTDALKWDAVPQDVLPMWVADMDFAAPHEVVDALRRRIGHPVFGYTRISDQYLNAFVQWQEKRNHFLVSHSEIIVAPGVMPAIRFAIDAFTDPGDRIIIQPPVYFPFYKVVEGRGRVLEPNPLIEEDGSYRMDLSALERSVADGARMLVLCSPHNPVGRVWTEQDLASVARICADNHVIVVSDEIHSDIIMPDFRFSSFIPAARAAGCQALSLYAPSKTFNIAGLPSCAVIPSDSTVGKTFKQGLYAGNLEIPNLLSMVAAQAAYEHGAVWLDGLLRYLDGNYRFMQEYMKQKLPDVRVFPLEGTYIAWLDFRALRLSDDEIATRLLSDAKVRLNEGRQFGVEGSGFQRLNFACPRRLLEDGLERIAGAFHSPRAAS